MKDIVAEIVAGMGLFVIIVGVGFAFILGIQQASQDAYQEGFRAGKASAQAAAYDQGYERGYASALYEVG